MLFKVLSMILTQVLGQATQSPEQSGLFARLNMNTLRSILTVLTTVAISVVAFFTGLLTLVLDLVLSSRDNSGSLALSQVSIVAAILMVLSVLAIALSFRKHMAPEPLPEPARPHERSSALQDALAMLVMDFVQERQTHRQHQAAAEDRTADAAASTAPHTSDVR